MLKFVTIDKMLYEKCWCTVFIAPNRTGLKFTVM